MLGSKQTLTASSWRQAAASIHETVSPRQLDQRIEQTVAQVVETTKNKNVAYAWSGGKDAIALQKIMDLAGIHDAVLVHTNLEYPGFLQWAQENKPQRLTYINTGQDYDWLRQRPHMLFPRGRDASAWFRMVQHKGQRDYFRNNDLDLIALGRRRRDGNYTGPKGADTYTDRNGVTRWSPLADWTHEEVIALHARYRLTLPPIYGTPRGFQVGTGPWPARPGTSPDPDAPNYGWRELWNIDPGLVQTAADENLPGAQDFVRRNK